MTAWFARPPDLWDPSAATAGCLRFARACALPLAWLAKRNPSLDDDLVGVRFPLGYRVFASKPSSRTA